VWRAPHGANGRIRAKLIEQRRTAGAGDADEKGGRTRRRDGDEKLA
jgi:hypothetical protein